MIWNSASDFWHMGGYGLYVWGSMAAVALSMGLEVWLCARGQAAALQQVRDGLHAQSSLDDWAQEVRP